ncbi:MSMEG_1061 family FMN-dependent PPOX-type flavoprotein [Paracidovorax avenae]|uniref:MSMEG_1061 family FMN-dependent PPOX-type flavoprotein n=1 Tax=Paracidovorax avenae TaxID=80867 RepID=UPI000D22C19A|nr:MSMEG_1061 family FMN-dependent PPOX-type flavoprotein [Paracidovorax avenae]AVS85268.1 pyridoxamine 5'-phosphate oxidase [Paracidovorax avenae]AVS96125.1 pyridoxamine 5'-phosphate oxidase [Paracidovorax avenae]AVT09892.1 pyridoxamine 5'-phosphate oxidase [Paracidovorax avenae]
MTPQPASRVPDGAPVIDLDALYNPPSDTITRSVLPALTPFHVEYLRAATFFCLATAGGGGLDASPRGGPPGFVQALDERTVAFADWPGNNRLASLRNLGDDARVAMLFLFPGLDIFLRINGRAQLSLAPDLLAKLAEHGKHPKLGVVVDIDETLFHCGKAIHRAQLWAPESSLDRRDLPTPGRMKAAVLGWSEAQASDADAHYAHAVRHGLY